jgi:hypothetical protein
VGEDCDFAQFNQDGVYGGCTLMCMDGPYCGDGNADDPYEECDEGTLDNIGAYDGCDENCVLGPHCGDGVTQMAQGEECDNGFNDDTYAFTTDACGEACSDVPFCGDGVLQSAYEVCDAGSDNSDTLYDGCATDCDWGPYCGDGQLDATETCDDGLNNRAYSSSGQGCGYDCEPAPYCGDGERNGPEQCDLGTAQNTGDYGTCETNCTLAPRCGDRVLQRPEGEECDDGPIGSVNCRPDCKLRVIR